jgi:hypothetical protein
MIAATAAGCGDDVGGLSESQLARHLRFSPLFVDHHDPGQSVGNLRVSGGDLTAGPTNTPVGATRTWTSSGTPQDVFEVRLKALLEAGTVPTVVTCTDTPDMLGAAPVGDRVGLVSLDVHRSGSETVAVLDVSIGGQPTVMTSAAAPPTVLGTCSSAVRDLLASAT